MLDAYALIALLADEPAAMEVSELIAAEETGITVPNLAEAADQLGRTYGITVQRTRRAVESLQQAVSLRVLAVGPTHTWRAAELRTKHYHRTNRPLSLGDCMLLAMTDTEDQLATSDPHVLRTAAEEEIGWIALADSSGSRHVPT